MSAELTWRVALLGVISVTDIVVFIGLVAKELRDRNATRTVERVEGTLGKPA
jgi:hypothetical protein